MLAGVVTTAVTALVLVLPVVSGLGPDAEPLALDSSSSTTAPPSAEEGSPVLMGSDGRPVASSSFAGAVPSAPAGEAADVDPGTTDAPAATSGPADAPGSASASAGGSSAPGGPSTAPSSSASSSRPQSAGSSSSRGSSSDSASSRGSSSDSSSPDSSSGASAPDPAGPPASAPAPAPATEPGETGAEDDLLEALNEARGDCAPLTVDRSLAGAARAHSSAMRASGRLRPVAGGPAGSVAHGGTNADQVLSSWLADPTGRATILDCSRREVGIALVRGAGGPWWTLLIP